jgi:hypothetical protein
VPAECLFDVAEPPDAFDCPVEKARQLLRKTLPDDVWSRFQASDVLELNGRRGTYLIIAHSLTKIYHPITGQCTGYACLQLSTSAPDYDRMLVEYLLLKNDEDEYWRTANIFSPASDITVFFLIFFDLWLAVYLLQLLLQ